MKLDVQIKNLGKLRNTRFKIRPLTIIAGVNSSGKSFFTKSFYSLLKVHSTDHITNAFKIDLENIVTLLKYIEDDLPRRSQTDINYIKDINNRITHLLDVVDNQLSTINLNMQFQIIETTKFRKHVNKLSILIKNFIASLKGKPTKYKKVTQFIAHLQDSIESISEITSEPESFNFRVLVPSVTNELRENFQIRRLSDLTSKSVSTGEGTEITIEGMVSLRFSQKNFAYEGDKQWRKNIKIPTTVIFFESPVYWRLKDVFDSLERTSKQSQYLTGIPKYFYDLAHLLRLTPKAEIEFPEILEKITKTIHGQILLSPTGSLIYKDDRDEYYSLNTTASGISNLGMIGLLLEKNIITKGSFLIIDEPETNLHPEWQMVLMEILFELSQKGVNVVIATHSLDMVECLSVILQKAVNEQKDITDLVGINLLNEDGENEEMSDDILQQIYQVHENLSDPYAVKRMESLKYD